MNGMYLHGGEVELDVAVECVFLWSAVTHGRLLDSSVGLALQRSGKVREIGCSLLHVAECGWDENRGRVW